VRPWPKTSTHYFSCSGGPNAVCIKSALGHVTLNLHFLHLLGSMSHIVDSDVSRVGNDDALFFMLR
jgi:hypothetical protein